MAGDEQVPDRHFLPILVPPRVIEDAEAQRGLVTCLKWEQPGQLLVSGNLGPEPWIVS